MSNRVMSQALSLLKKVSPKAANVLNQHPELVNKAAGMLGNYTMDKKGALKAIGELKSQGKFDQAQNIISRIPFAKTLLSSMGLGEVLSGKGSSEEHYSVVSSTASNLRDRLKKLK